MRSCVFIGGVVKAADVAKLDLGELPRVAFAGRSNVGKSSLLNALAEKKVARVSSEPGKTREMNFFRWKSHGKHCLLVDLPGYGYAKVAMSLRDQWGKEIGQWLSSDPYLRLVIALVDSRHGYQNNDIELLEYLQSKDLPYLVAFTKMDKWKSSNQRREAERNLKLESEKLGVANFIFTSGEAKGGVQSLLDVLKNVLLC